jgi:hypothetical protein
MRAFSLFAAVCSAGIADFAIYATTMPGQNAALFTSTDNAEIVIAAVNVWIERLQADRKEKEGHGWISLGNAFATRPFMVC